MASLSLSPFFILARERCGVSEIGSDWFLSLSLSVFWHVCVCVSDMAISEYVRLLLLIFFFRINYFDILFLNYFLRNFWLDLKWVFRNLVITQPIWGYIVCADWRLKMYIQANKQKYDIDIIQSWICGNIVKNYRRSLSGILWNTTTTTTCVAITFDL